MIDKLWDEQTRSKRGNTKKESDCLSTIGLPEERQRPTLPTGVSVPSARTGLTSLFGMGRGGTPRLKPPQYFT